MTQSRELLKKAEKAEASGDFHSAAELFERSGEADRAVAAYRRAGAVDRAAQLYERLGRAAEAGALYMACGQPLQAAALFERSRAFGKAASALLRANQRERAAAMFERAEMFDDAAKIYASLGNHRRALQLYEHTGNDRLAGELRASLAKEGTVVQDAAEEVLELDPSMEVSAEQYLDAKQLVGVVVAHLKAGRVPEATKLYENCTEDIGFNVLAAIAGDRDMERGAAEMFQAARDYAKAAQIFENLEDYARAGAMFERADDAYMAAEMYIRGGDVPKAAEMLEKYGNYKQAAEYFLQVKNFEKAALNFEKAMNNFVAARLYHRMNRTKKSLQLLQKVQKSEREYFQACRLMGQILATNGYLDLAVRKYLEVVDVSELTDESAEAYYGLARALEGRGESARAKELYERLTAWKMDYLDAAERARALTGKTAAAPPPAATASSAPREQPSEEPAPEAAQPQLVSMMAGFEFLKKTHLFAELTLEEMKVVYNACETRHFEPGEALIEEGQPGEALYVLRAGRANVVKAGGSESVVAKLGPGSPAGEMALVDDAPTSARVVAETAVDAFVITRARFEKLLASNDKTAVKLFRFFVQVLAKRLRNTSQSLATSVEAERKASRGAAVTS